MQIEAAQITAIMEFVSQWEYIYINNINQKLNLLMEEHILVVCHHSYHIAVGAQEL